MSDGGPAADRPGLNRGLLHWLLWSLLLAALASGLYYRFGRERPLPVRLVTLGYGVVEDTVANTRAGTVRACRRAGISPRVGGQIARMPVKEGERVAQGQLLMEFWHDDLSARVKLAKSERVSADAKAEQACVLARVAQREARRQQQLKRQQLAADEAVEKAQGEAQAKQAACAAARAAVQVSQAKLEVAQAVLDQTRLRAPFAGIVAEVNGEVGEFVTPSPVGIPTPPAVDLMDTGCLYVSAPIDEVDAPGVELKMPVRIALDAFPKRRFKGRVRRIAPYVLDREKQARTVDVEVAFAPDEETDKLLPGYSADIEIILASHPRVLRIPSEAVLEGNRVYRVDAMGRLQSRKLEIGLHNWSWSEVIAGLRAGDRVVGSVDRKGVAAGVLVRAEPAGDD